MHLTVFWARIHQKYAPICAKLVHKIKNCPTSQGAHPPSDTPSRRHAAHFNQRFAPNFCPPLLKSFRHPCYIYANSIFLLPNIKHNSLALTPLNLSKHYCRKCKNWSKSDYVIDTGPIQVQNRWPGSVTGVAWHGWSRDWCARGPVINSGGNHLFWWCQFQMR